MKVLKEVDYDTYFEVMYDPQLNEAAAGDSGHVDDHNTISELLSTMIPFKQMDLVKTGDNAWTLDGDSLTDEDAEGFLTNPAPFMIAVVPNDWTSASAAPTDTIVSVYHIGVYGLLVHLGQLESRIEQLEAAATNPG